MHASKRLPFAQFGGSIGFRRKKTMMQLRRRPYYVNNPNIVYTSRWLTNLTESRNEQISNPNYQALKSLYISRYLRRKEVNSKKEIFFLPDAQLLTEYNVLHSPHVTFYFFRWEEPTRKYTLFSFNVVIFFRGSSWALWFGNISKETK